MARSSIRQAALRALVASLVLSGALGIVALLVENFGELQARVLLTSLTVSAASILALACSAALERKQYVNLARTGIGVTVLATALILTTIWFEVDNEPFLRLLASAGTAAIALAHCSLLSIAALHSRYRQYRHAAFGFAALLTIALIVFYWTEYDDQWYLRLLGILSICVTVLTILVPIFHKMSQNLLRAERPVPAKINLASVFGGIAETWSPVAIAELGSNHVVRAARVEGVFPAHAHDEQDEFFLVVKGSLRLRFGDDEVVLDEGEGLLVPAGVKHQPEADTEAHILLFEPTSTRPKGNAR